MSDLVVVSPSLSESETRLAFLLHLADELNALAEPEAVHATLTQTARAFFGADRCGYGELRNGQCLVRRDAAGDGLASVAGAYALNQTPGFRAAVAAGQPVVVGDVRTTELLDEPLRRLCEQHNVRALLAVPVRQEGQAVGILALGQRTPRRWTPHEVALLAEVAERARAAVARTGREADLRRRERQQAFLVQLTDALRPLEAPAAIQGAATRLLREQFGAGWCYYVEWDETGTVGEVLRDDTRPGLPSMRGRHDVADAPEFTGFLRSGQLLNVPDFARCDLFNPRVVATYTGIGIHACLNASLVKNGRLIATLTLADTVPRDWPAAAVALVQEVAERTWAALEQARAEEARRQSEAKYRQQAEHHRRELEARVAERTAQLRRQESQLQQILGQVPAAIATLTGPEHRFAFFNEAYQTMSRRPIREGQSIAELFPEAIAQGFMGLLDGVYATGRSVSGTENPVDFHDPATGEIMRRYVDFSYQSLPAESDRPAGILAFVVDVTEQVLVRQQNETLQAELLASARLQAQEREAFYQAFEQTTAAIALLRGPHHRYEYVNPAYQSFLPGHQLVGLDVAVANPEVVEPGFITLLDRVYQTGETHFGTEVPVTHSPAADQPARGAYFNFSYQAYREASEIVGIYVVAYDVTEQVRARQQNEALQAEVLAAAEQRARDREALYQVFEQTAVVVALLRGPGHRFEYVNPPYQAFNPGRQLVGLDVAAATPEVVAPGFVALLDHVYQTGETFFGTEVPFTPPPAPGQPARPAYFNFTYQAYREAGEIVGISIFATDVTEQVQARQAQEAQRRELEQLFRQAPAPIVILDGPALVFQLINPAYQRIFPGRALAGKPLLEAMPELVGTPIPDLFAGVYRTGEPVTVQELPLMQARHEGAAPEEIYWTFTYQARRDADGAIDGVRVFAHDVTEQVRARAQLHRLHQESAALNAQLRDFNAALAQQVAERTQTLRESRDLLQSIFDTNFTALLVLRAERDAQGALRDFRVELSNEEAARQTGRADLVGQPYPRMFPGLFELMRRALETGAPQQQEFVYPSDGGPHWYSILFVKLADGVVVHSLDITTRKLAEQERRRHLVLLEQAEAVAGLGSWDYDRATGALRWSDGLYHLLGLAPGEAVQPARYFDYVVPKDRPVVERLLAYLTVGEGPFGETLRLHVGRQVKTVRLQAVVLPAAGQAERVLGVYLDISEVQRLTADSLRLGQQQALFEAVLLAQETERRRIAEGLHNGVGQLLFATKLRLDQLHTPALSADQALVARREADRLLAEAIRQTRVLSHELVPVALEEFGLVAALQDICRQLSTPQLPLRCHVVLDADVPPLPPLLQLALYRMAQELGLNIVKHARGATEASLELETTPGFVLLRAEDNGAGFAHDPAADLGLGLRTIRDRVALLNGTLDVGHQAGFGTFVRLRLPLPTVPPA